MVFPPDGPGRVVYQKPMAVEFIGCIPAVSSDAFPPLLEILLPEAMDRVPETNIGNPFVSSVVLFEIFSDEKNITLDRVDVPPPLYDPAPSLPSP